MSRNSRTILPGSAPQDQEPSNPGIRDELRAEILDEATLLPTKLPKKLGERTNAVKRKEAEDGMFSIMDTKFPGLGGEKSLDDILPERSPARRQIEASITDLIQDPSKHGDFQKLLDEVETKAVVSEVKERMDKARQRPGLGTSAEVLGTSSVMHTPLLALGAGSSITPDQLILHGTHKQVHEAVRKYVNNTGTPDELSSASSIVLNAVKVGIRREQAHAHVPSIGTGTLVTGSGGPMTPPPVPRNSTGQSWQRPRE